MLNKKIIIILFATLSVFPESRTSASFVDGSILNSMRWNNLSYSVHKISHNLPSYLKVEPQIINKQAGYSKVDKIVSTSRLTREGQVLGEFKDNRVHENNSIEVLDKASVYVYCGVENILGNKKGRCK